MSKNSFDGNVAVFVDYKLRSIEVLEKVDMFIGDYFRILYHR